MSTAPAAKVASSRASNLMTAGNGRTAVRTQWLSSTERPGRAWRRGHWSGLRAGNRSGEDPDRPGRAHRRRRFAATKSASILVHVARRLCAGWFRLPQVEERRGSAVLCTVVSGRKASHSLVVKLVTPRDHDGVVTLSGRSRRRPWPVRPAARESRNALAITRCAPPVGITGPRPGSRGGRGREICVFASDCG